MLNGNVLGVEVNQALGHSFQPCINILSRQVGIPSVEIDSDRRRIHQIVDAVQTIRCFGVLGVTLQADLDTPSLRHERGLLQGVLDQDKILLFRGPLGLDALVCVDNRHADLRGHADGEFDVLAVHLGPAQRPVRLQTRHL